MLGHRPHHRPPDADTLIGGAHIDHRHFAIEGRARIARTPARPESDDFIVMVGDDAEFVMIAGLAAQMPAPLPDQTLSRHALEHRSRQQAAIGFPPRQCLRIGQFEGFLGLCPSDEIGHEREGMPALGNWLGVCLRHLHKALRREHKALLSDRENAGHSCFGQGPCRCVPMVSGRGRQSPAPRRQAGVRQDRAPDPHLLPLRRN